MEVGATRTVEIPSRRHGRYVIRSRVGHGGMAEVFLADAFPPRGDTFPVALKLMQKAAALCATPLFTNQVSYSVPDRTSVENGVLNACQRDGILITAYSPVKRRNIKSNPVLKYIARARDLTSQQVALAWLMNQPGVITIPMSGNPQHQAENLQAVDVLLTADEIESINRSI